MDVRTIKNMHSSIEKEKKYNKNYCSQEMHVIKRLKKK